MSFADIYKERSLLIGFSNIVIIIIDEISFALWWCLKLYIYSLSNNFISKYYLKL